MFGYWESHLQAMLDTLRQVEYAETPVEQLEAALMLANLNHVNGVLVTYASSVALDGKWLDGIQQEGLAAYLDADELARFLEEGVTI